MKISTKIQVENMIGVYKIENCMTVSLTNIYKFFLLSNF